MQLYVVGYTTEIELMTEADLRVADFKTFCHTTESTEFSSAVAAIPHNRKLYHILLFSRYPLFVFITDFVICA